MRPVEPPSATSSSAGGSSHDEIVQALVGLNCDSNLAVVRRTRYAVRDTALVLRERRQRLRQNVGFALLAMFILLILLAPAIWNSAEELMSGEHLADFPIQMAFLLLMIAPAMFAALVAIWKEQHSMRRQESDS